MLFGWYQLAPMTPKNLRPNELRREFAAAGIMLDDMTGLAPRPGGGFKQTGSLAINYAASGGFI